MLTTPLLGLNTESLFRRLLPSLELLLLDIEIILLVAPLHALHPVPQLPLLRADNAAADSRNHPTVIMQVNQTAIFIFPRVALSLASHKARDSLGQTKGDNDLIDKVGT